MKKHDHRVVTENIKQRYGTIAQQRVVGGCCTGTCSCTPDPKDIAHNSSMLGYQEQDLATSAGEANLGLGCGNPLAFASLSEGETVLDLGSGGGFDCFLARRQVGEHGKVIGVDMTPQMIELARANATRLGYTNVEFIEGTIETLPVDDNSIDVIISNCVINLSLDKQQVFREACRVLKPGGRIAVSDIVATAELPDRIREDLRLHAGCIAGAEHVAAISRMLERAGFIGISLSPKDTSKEILSAWVPDSDLDRYVASYLIEATKPLR